MKKGSKVRQILAVLERKSSRGIHILENSFLIIGVFLVAILVTLEAVLRYTMHSMPLGIEESALITAVWVYFIGIAIAMRDRKQITVTVLNILPIPRSADKYLDIITNVITLAVCSLFAYHAIVWCRFVYTAHLLIPPFYVSALVSYLSFAIGLTLACVYSLIQLVRKFTRKVSQ